MGEAVKALEESLKKWKLIGEKVREKAKEIKKGV